MDAWSVVENRVFVLLVVEAKYMACNLTIMSCLHEYFGTMYITKSIIVFNNLNLSSRVVCPAVDAVLYFAVHAYFILYLFI